MKIFLGILSFTLLLFTNLSGQSKMINGLLSQFDEQEQVDVMISMEAQMDLLGKTDGMTKLEKGSYVHELLTNFAHDNQASIIDYLNENDIDFQSYHVFNGIKAKLSKAQLFEIEKRNDVAWLSYDQPVMVNEYFDEFVTPRMDAEWGIQKILADSVWTLGIEGQGVVVAGQDTGYDFENEIILDKYRGYTDTEIVHDYNWHDAIFEINPLHGDTIPEESLNPCGFLSSMPCDDHSHGTHTMGTMVGQDTSNIIGVAPQAEWIGCRNMERGYGKPSTYTECFEWFLAPTDLNGENPDPSMAPHVINNSWGCPDMEGCNDENWHIMETVVNNLTAAGIVVVVSAGNDGSSNCNSIMNAASIFENSFTVGATDIVDTIAGFSSIGPVAIDGSGRMKPDVVAPGVGVRSITLSGFGTWSGTSMAGPHVAGAVALMISANPDLAGEVELIKDILKETAVPLYGEMVCDSLQSDLSPNFVYGHGRINVFAAVQEALNFNSTDEQESLNGIVKVFPNPVDSEVSFSILDGGIVDNILVFNSLGELVKSSKPKSTQFKVDLSNQISGMYIYQVQINDQWVSGLIMKQ